MSVVDVTDVRSYLDFNGTVTRFRVRSWSLSDSAFVVRSSTSRSSRSGWTIVCGRLEFHAGERVSVEEALADLPLGGRSLVLRAGRNRVVAVATLPESGPVGS